MPSYNPPRYLFRRHTILRTLKPGKSFLEVGAGNLKLSQELLNFYDSGVAVDFEKGVKDLAETLPETVQKRLTVKIGDFSKDKSNTKYSCVLACEVLEHVKDDAKFLAQLHAKLAKGGQVVISVPAKQKYWTIHDQIAGHFRRYEKQQLVDLLKDAGFKDIRVYSYGFPYINGLRLLRALHGKRQAKSKLNWSKQKQTKHSGIHQNPKKLSFVGWIVNPITFYPLNASSTLFDRFDLSEGYVVTATK